MASGGRQETSLSWKQVQRCNAEQRILEEKGASALIIHLHSVTPPDRVGARKAAHIHIHTSLRLPHLDALCR